ncbi:hypothetical protein VTK26DRAFT_7339 [Humicola hyalothermophila]
MQQTNPRIGSVKTRRPVRAIYPAKQWARVSILASRTGWPSRAEAQPRCASSGISTAGDGDIDDRNLR